MPYTSAPARRGSIWEACNCAAWKWTWESANWIWICAAAPKHSYNVAIHGGIGEATVRLSADAGIYAEAHGGIGSIKVRGLQQEDGHWVSPSYDRAENKIRIEIQGGIGQINVIAD